MSRDEAQAQALKQVEFYFADANLPFDKFLFTLTRKDPEGWVPIETLASFKRMRPIKDVLGVDGIAEALRASTELLEVNEAGDRVRRAKALVPVTDGHARSIYAKGFPDEYPELQVDLERFFAQFGKINGVRMRRENEKPRKFKNSVFVEFAEPAELDAFMAKARSVDPLEDGGRGIEYNGKPLDVMSKPAYVAMKMKEKGIDPSTNTPSKGPRKFNAFRELEREKHTGGGARDAPAGSSRAEPLEFEYNGKMLTTTPDGSIDAAEVTYPADSVLRFTNAAAGGSWKDLKDTLSTMHPTSFVEFPDGAVEGVVGFKEPVSDEKLAEIRDKAITVGGQAVAWERLADAQAKDFYVERAKFRAAFLLDRREQERNQRGGRGDRGVHRTPAGRVRHAGRRARAEAVGR